jgi:peptidyl-prolyl cis-trans isomerase SurA
MSNSFSFSRIARRFTIAVAAAAIVALPAISRAQQIDKIVASVDGDPITIRDVRVFAQSAGQPIPPGDPTADPIFKEGLKGLIAQKLLAEEVKKYDDKVDDSQIDKYIADIEEERNITDQQLRQSLMQNGISYDDFRKQARLELEKAMMLNEELRQRVTIPANQIQAYYDAHQDEFTVKKERYQLAQILISVAPTAPQAEVVAAKAKADDVRKKLLAGQDFGELAKRYSDDESKEHGGELGVFGPDDIMDEILGAIKTVPPGQISDVVRSKNGFHIIKVEAHETVGLKPLVVVKEQIRSKLVDDQTKSRLQSWVETELVKQHDVETMY